MNARNAPTESGNSRADKLPPRRTRRPRCRPDEQDPDTLSSQPASHPPENSTWRSKLPAEFRNASREELLAMVETNLCGVVGVDDPDVAKRILGQSFLMRTFGEPHGFNLGKPDVEAAGLLGEFAPRNIMESMLVVQMSGVHEAALAFLKAAGGPGLSQRQRDAEMGRATELMHLFYSQLATMMKLKNQEWDRRGPAGRALSK
jgi:hypothetical protein